MIAKRATGRVLIAEDNVDIRAVMAAALRADGHEVVEVSDGRELVDVVRREPLDAIVSDLRLPGLSGLGALAQLRALRCHVPVLLVTAYGDAAVQDEAVRLGVDDLLHKPFDVFDLRRLVARLVKRSQH